MTTNSAELKPCKCGQTSRWCGENECPELPLPSQACTAAQGEQSKADEPKCGCCGGTGRMVRDPDIGTDQECFACDGTGRGEDDQAGSAEQVSEEAEFEKWLDEAKPFEAFPRDGKKEWMRRAWNARAALSAPERKVTDAELPPLPDEQILGTEVCGHVLEAYGYTADQMREYALAALNQQGEQTAPEGAKP